MSSLAFFGFCLVALQLGFLVLEWYNEQMALRSAMVRLHVVVLGSSFLVAIAMGSLLGYGYLSHGYSYAHCERV